MPDFIPVLTVAIILLLALLIGLGGYIVPSETTETGGTHVSYEDSVSLGSNFTVSDYTEGVELVNLGGNVSAGIISSEQKINSFDINRFDDITYGKIKFTVKDTNLYGTLMMIVNGNVVYDQPTMIGDHEVTFDKDILTRTNNQLIVRAGGSGWRLWAPTVYLFNLSLTGETDDVSTKSFDFDITDVPYAATLKVYISDRKGDANLIVNINGYRVFKGKSNAFKAFDVNVLKAGTNTAEFIAEPGSRYAVQSAYIEFE